MPAPSYPEYAYPDFQIPGVNTPAVSGLLTGVRDKQRKAATDFRSQMPQYGDQLYSQYESQARKQLAGSIQDVRKDYNRRGLLQSGRRMSGEGSERAKTSGDLLNARQGINQNLSDTANKLDDSVFQSDLAIAGYAPGLGSSSLSGLSTDLGNDISNLEANQKVIGGAGSGLGQLAGSIIAQRRGYQVAPGRGGND